MDREQVGAWQSRLQNLQEAGQQLSLAEEQLLTLCDGWLGLEKLATRCLAHEGDETDRCVCCEVAQVDTLTEENKRLKALLQKSGVKERMMAIRFRATETTCEKVEAGQAFSSAGPEYWDHPTAGTIGERVFLRTDAPCPVGDIGTSIYIITVEQLEEPAEGGKEREMVFATRESLEGELGRVCAENAALNEKYSTMYRHALGLEEGLAAIRRRCQTDPSNLPAVMLAGEIAAMVTALLSPQPAEVLEQARLTTARMDDELARRIRRRRRTLPTADKDAIRAEPPEEKTALLSSEGVPAEGGKE